MKRENKYIVGIYCRLSRDDDNYSESESIVNQRRMLAKYVEDHGWSIYNYYIDDGISGTTFNRPAFQEMLKDIEDKKINLVITKDLSRLGRDYITTGHYIEIYFPEKNVRYIAVNDGIDTIKNDNDIAPFKNILNEMYAKDISRKVRAAFKTKIENGEFIGAFAPFGYKKHPENKNKLIIDEYSANIVRKIFSMTLEGYGLNKIARIFNSEGVPNPTMYKSINNSTYINNRKLEKTYYWTNTTIRNLLKREIYIGVLAQGKQRTMSFKCKKKIHCSENDWVVVKDAVDPIIDNETWEKVQKLLSSRRRQMSDGETHIFSGLIKCADCERFMALGRKAGYQYFVCGTYKNYGPEHCSRHGISYDHLYSIVLQDIQYHAKFANIDESALIEKLMLSDRTEKESFNDDLSRETRKMEDRIREIDKIVMQMYEDRVRGSLPEKRFSFLSEQYDQEQSRLSLKLKEIDKKLSQYDAKTKDIDCWVRSIKKYVALTELDKVVINELIEKIIIGEKKCEGKTNYQDIRIVYKFIGEIV